MKTGTAIGPWLLCIGIALSAIADPPSSTSNPSEVESVDPPDCPTEDTGGDPVGYEDGSVFVVAEDLRVACPDIDLVFRRAYGSWSHRPGPLGFGWTHSYDWRIEEAGDAVRVYSAGESGVSDAVHTFVRIAPGESYANPDGYRLERSEDGLYSVVTPYAQTYSFDALKRLSSISAWNGTSITLERQAPRGLVSQAVHPCGRWLRFEYDAQGNLERVETPDEEVYAEYSVGQRSLDAVVRHDGGSASTNTYAYSNAPVPGTRDGNSVIIPSLHGSAAGPGGVSPYEGKSPAGVSDGGLSRVASASSSYGGGRKGPDVIGIAIDTGDAGSYPVLSAKTDANGIGASFSYIRPTDSPQPRCTHMEMDGGLFSTDMVFMDRATVEAKPTAWGSVRTTLLFDERRREIARERYAERVTKGYDAAGDLVCVALTNSATGSSLETRLSYDAAHDVVSSGVGFNAPPSRFLRLEWDGARRIPRRIVSPEGREWEWTQDGLEIAVHGAGTNDARNVSRILLDDREHPLAVLPPDGGRLDIAYDSSGYATNFAASCLPPVSLGYDALGHVSAVAIPGPDGTQRAVAFTNNWRGRPLSVAFPDGSVESFGYDGNGRRVTRHVDALGREDVFQWVLGLPVHAGRVVGGVTNALFGVEHDAQLNVVAVTDPLGRRAETYILDGNERVVAVTNVEGQAMSVGYAVGGVVSSVARFDGTTVFCGHDAAGNLVSVAYPGETLAFAYDGDGLLASASNAAGTVTNGYDAATGWLMASRGADGTLVEYARRNGGDVAAVSSVAGTVSYAFDAAGRRTEITSPAGTFGLGYCGWNGGIAAVTNGHGLVTEYAYDVMDRVTNIAWRTAGGAPLGGFSYSYDAAGRIVSRGHSLGDPFHPSQMSQSSQTTYAYDALDRLVSDGGVAYAYDAAGNRMSRTEVGGSVAYTLGAGDRLASWTGSTSGAYAHDAAGCVTSIVSSAGLGGGGASPPGEPLVRTLSWNSLYQLVSVSTNGAFAEGYAYDALGRRVSTTTAEGTVRHVYDDRWQVISDLDEQGGVIASYVWGEGIDSLLAVKVGGGSYYPLTDIQGTVWGYADTNNAVVARWIYDAWGNVLDEEVSVPALARLRYRFQGREWSAATGLVHFRMRWYDPETGRWLSKDPIGLLGGVNLYEFCGNDACNHFDPDGLSRVVITDINGERISVSNPSLEDFRDIISEKNDKSIDSITIYDHGWTTVMSIDGDGYGFHVDLNDDVLFDNDGQSVAKFLGPKIREGGTIVLSGCCTAYDGWFSRSGTNISKALSSHLRNVRVTGNRGFAFGNKIGPTWNFGIHRTYVNGEQK